MHVASIQFRMLGLLAIGTICSLIACGGGASGGSANPGSSSPGPVASPSIRAILMTPLTLTLNAGDQAQFEASVSGTGSFDTRVVWSAERGTVTSGGLYTAPATAGADTVTAASEGSPTTLATAVIIVNASAAAGAPPVAPALSGPAEVQAQSGPYAVSVALDASLTPQWTITGGTLLSGAASATAQFQAGTGATVTLTCTVSNGAGSASASRQVVVLPFAPRNNLNDLKGDLASFASSIATEVASGDVGTYYSTSYYLHGLAAAAEATGDTGLMDQLLAQVSGILAKAQPFPYNGVTYQELPPWDGVYPQQLQTFQISSALARTAAVIGRNPTFKTRYATQMNQIVAFVDQSIYQYWFDKQVGVYADPRGPYLGGQVPWLPASLGGWGSYPVWNDKCSHFGAMSAWMYQATGNPLYKEYASRVAQAFRTHITVRNGAWIWDLGTVPIDNVINFEGSPDTSHANREPMMVVAMYESGIEFQLADVQAMAVTFTDLIWNQSETDPRFNNYIDGGNAQFRTLTAWQNGNIYLGWNMLGRYDAKVQRVLDLTCQIIRTQANLNPSLSVNGCSYGRVELAGTQLRNNVH